MRLVLSGCWHRVGVQRSPQRGIDIQIETCIISENFPRQRKKERSFQERGIQLTLEQRGFELCKSTYTWIFFNRLLRYYPNRGWLKLQMGKSWIQSANSKVTQRFSTLPRVGAPAPAWFKGQRQQEKSKELSSNQFYKHSVWAAVSQAVFSTLGIYR